MWKAVKPLAAVLALALCSPAHAKGKLIGNTGGNEREGVVYSPKGLEGWTITGPDATFEFLLEPGEYMVSCGGKLAPYVRIREGQTTYISHSDNPEIGLESEMWAPPHVSFGQTYTATGTAFAGVGFWMAQGSTRLKLTLREGGPDGRVIGENADDDTHEWITGMGIGKLCPTTPGETYYLELTSTEGIAWGMGMPKGPDPYSGGIAYYDGVPHPESDLGVTVWEEKPGLADIASAQADQHFIEKGPGSGSCRVAGQSFIAKNGKNVISLSANCGFGGGVTDFIYAIREGGPDGKVLVSKNARMVSDWGTTAYFEPDEVALKPGQEYFFEYRRADGEPFYSYLSADVYPHGRAYRDGKEVEGFDQMFEVRGEIEPGGITFPYNVRISDITSDSARVSWETGTEADGIVYYGENADVKLSATANEDLSREHSALLKGLKPGTVHYCRVTSFTHKEGAGRTYGRLESFMTLPAGKDQPRFDKPVLPCPAPEPGPKSVAVVNGGFEDGLTGWRRCSKAEPKESKDYPIGNGPFGKALAGDDGYRPRFGKQMYGWKHLGADDPNPVVPREDWKHEIIYQRVRVTPGHRYALSAWLMTGDRDSGWGRDSRIRLEVDPKDRGALESVDASSKALATQWFATENDWKLASLRFTAEKDTAVIGVHFLQWWALEANYLYVDEVRVEEVEG